MAIALGGRPDDSAKMVWSRGCIAYLLPGASEGNAILICGNADRIYVPGRDVQQLCCSNIPALQSAITAERS